MYLRCVIFAPQVICLRALGANIISLLRSSNIVFAQQTYHSSEDGISQEGENSERIFPLFLIYLLPNCQKATALAAATFSESTPWDMGMRTV